MAIETSFTTTHWTGEIWCWDTCLLTNLVGIHKELVSHSNSYQIGDSFEDHSFILTLASSLKQSMISFVATSLCIGAPQFFTHASNTLMIRKQYEIIELHKIIQYSQIIQIYNSYSASSTVSVQKQESFF